jgi:hypothetical protein
MRVTYTDLTYTVKLTEHRKANAGLSHGKLIKTNKFSKKMRN